ncbi:MAG: phosphoglucosamine mutase [Clostridiaceae bacterium]
MGRMFGTDGVRGIANKELTASLAYNLGKAGAYVLTNGTHKPKILVGMDTRVSGHMLESALVAGILSVGAEAVCLGVVPTPAIAHLTRKYEADAGVVISASHNPVEYNGIKFFDGQGYKLSDELEDKIQMLIENNFEGVPCPIGEGIGRRTIEEGTALKDYINYAVSTVNTDLKGMKIALDCANGAAYKAAVEGFKELGAEIYPINNKPNGININKNCGSTHPEDLMKFVVDNGCDLGLAFDGDADRCLAVDEKGNLVNGDFIMAICGKHMKEQGKLDRNTVVVTVMSNMGLFIAMDKEKIDLVKTKVGDRYVLEEMLKEGYKIGGEQSGHIIFLEHNTTGDGLVTALQLSAIVKKSGKKLSELTSIMRELPQVLVNAKVPNDKKKIYIEDREIAEEIEKIEEKMNGKGRVLIRPSGTEPLVRVMLEGEDQEEIDVIAHNLAKLIEEKAAIPLK